MQRRTCGDEEAPGMLPESAVVSKLLHALESPRPEARCYVTVSTWAPVFLERMLPNRWLDAALCTISGSEIQRGLRQVEPRTAFIARRLR